MQYYLPSKGAEVFQWCHFGRRGMAFAVPMGTIKVYLFFAKRSFSESEDIIIALGSGKSVSFSYDTASMKFNTPMGCRG